MSTIIPTRTATILFARTTIPDKTRIHPDRLAFEFQKRCLSGSLSTAISWVQTLCDLEDSDVQLLDFIYSSTKKEAIGSVSEHIYEKATNIRMGGPRVTLAAIEVANEIMAGNKPSEKQASGLIIKLARKQK